MAAGDARAVRQGVRGAHPLGDPALRKAGSHAEGGRGEGALEARLGAGQVEGRAQPVHQHRRGVQPRLRVRAQQVQGFQVRRRFFSRFDERSFSRKRSTGEQSHVSRNSKRVSVFFFFDEKRRRNARKDVRSRAPPLAAPRDATDFCSGSSPRTATLSWAAASPAPSASSPTTTCPRVRRASASDARSEVRARVSPLLRLRLQRATRAERSVPGPRGTSPGIPARPGDARARPGASRCTISRRPPPRAPKELLPRPTPPPRVRRARRRHDHREDPASVAVATETAVLLPNPQPTGRAGRSSRAGREPRRRSSPSRAVAPGARRTAAAARPSRRGDVDREPRELLRAIWAFTAQSGRTSTDAGVSVPRRWFAPTGCPRLRAVRRLRRRALRHAPRVRRLPRVQGRICRRLRRRAPRTRRGHPGRRRPANPCADVFTTPGDFAGGFAPSLLPLGGNGNPFALPLMDGRRAPRARRRRRRGHRAPRDAQPARAPGVYAGRRRPRRRRTASSTQEGPERRRATS